jgi:hypothetical protein
MWLARARAFAKAVRGRAAAVDSMQSAILPDAVTARTLFCHGAPHLGFGSAATRDSFPFTQRAIS